MHDIDRALADISSIRAQLATSTQFKGFAPGTLIFIAGIFAAVTLLQTLWPARFAPDDMSLVTTWGGLLLLTTAANAVESMIRAQHHHGGLGMAMWRSAMQVLGPVWVAGTVIAVMMAAHAPEAIWAAPGIWMLLIGLVGFAFHAAMPSGVFWIGLLYMTAGTLTLAIAGENGGLTPALIGIPLIIGNLGMAHILHQTAREPRHD